MLEIPESYVIVNQLNNTIRGKNNLCAGKSITPLICVVLWEARRL